MNDDTKKSLKSASKACVILSIIALHELGHRETAGWLAAAVAAFAFGSMICALLEGPLHRIQARMEASLGKRDSTLYYESMEYRKAWDKARSKIRSGK